MKDETSTTAAEINLCLDIDGRTTDDNDMSSSVLAVDGITTPEVKLGRVGNSEHTTSSTSSSSSLDYSSKTTMTNLSPFLIPSHDNVDDSSVNNAYDALLFDCEIADCGLMPRTFWVPASPREGTPQPRCYLEKLALEIFHHHVPSNG